MSPQRGFIPQVPAIAVSTTVLTVCAVAWGVLGTVAVLPVGSDVPPPLYRYLCALLLAVTICALLTSLYARLMRVVRPGADADSGYAEGYADGLAAAQARGASARVTQMPPRGSMRS